jgi:hypothetical protein
VEDYFIAYEGLQPIEIPNKKSDVKNIYPTLDIKIARFRKSKQQ